MEEQQFFGYYVPDLEYLGIVVFDENGQAITIEEKPAKPKSSYAVTDSFIFCSDDRKCQGVKISAPEEIVFRYGWIDKDGFLKSAEKYEKSHYGQHLKEVAEGKVRGYDSY